tara:strand:+ start:280 stop:468 length:189 start_codon:yes stop_codon:yes gene_type:complete
MRIIGYILIAIGVLDVVTSYVLPYGSPIDPIVGPEIAPYTGYIFIGIGYFLKGIGKSDDKED